MTRLFFALLELIEALPVLLPRGVRSLWRSRHFRAGLPALLVAIAGAGLALARWQIPARDLSERYVRAADHALRAGDDARARTYEHKALSLEGSSRTHLRAWYHREGERRLTAAADFAGARPHSWPGWPRPTGPATTPRTSGRPSGCCGRRARPRPTGVWPRCTFSSR